MTIHRLAAIGFIFLCTSICWGLLGGTVVARSGEMDKSLRSQVEQLWGGEHRQRAPLATLTPRPTGPLPVNKRPAASKVALSASDIDVDVKLQHRKKGLLWYPTYDVAFSGTYRVKNETRVPQQLDVRFDFPSSNAIYDGFVFRVNGADVPDVTDIDAGVLGHATLQPGQSAEVQLAYRSRGLESWRYDLGNGTTQLRDFSLDIAADFDEVDFPPGSLSPTTLRKEDGKASMAWRFESLVTGHDIALTMPAKLNPGPLVVRISFFAPVSLLFFFTVLVILGVMKGENLHPMNYFFLAAGFFAFHLLLAYLVDHVDVFVAFGLAAATSMGLVVSYLRIAASSQFAFARAGVAQFVFLVLFSGAFFYEGQTGLSVVIGAVLTLFVLMQLTARVDWGEVFGGLPSDKPTPGGSPVGFPAFGNTVAEATDAPSGS